MSMLTILALAPLCLVAPQTPDGRSEQIDRVLATYSPVVERLVGAKFVKAPRARLTSRNEWGELAADFTGPGGDVSLTRALLFSVYKRSERCILLSPGLFLGDRLATIESGESLSRDALGLAAIVVHELTHALDDERFGLMDKMNGADGTVRSDNYSWALTTIRSLHPGTAG